jgi:SPP1 family predicted phage head-tail adaptor
MMINQLRHKVTIERNTGSTNDGGGNKIKVWEPLAVVWANVRPLNGNETVIAERKSQEITHNITVRYRKDFKKDNHRINYNGRIMQIEYIINKDERNIELNLHCKEITVNKEIPSTWNGDKLTTSWSV